MSMPVLIVWHGSIIGTIAGLFHLVSWCHNGFLSYDGRLQIPASLALRLAVASARPVTPPASASPSSRVCSVRRGKGFWKSVSQSLLSLSARLGHRLSDSPILLKVFEMH